MVIVFVADGGGLDVNRSKHMILHDFIVFLFSLDFDGVHILTAAALMSINLSI
jgi:hypothetical protein